jgi:hypothetical protein
MTGTGKKKEPVAVRYLGGMILTGEAEKAE